MRLTKQLKEYLQWFDFYNTFEVANTIADYVEKKHRDEREIKDEYRELAERYIKEEQMYLEDEERTWKWIIEEFKEKRKQEKLKSLLEEVNNTYWTWLDEDSFRKHMIDKIYNHWNVNHHEAETIYEECCFIHNQK